MPEVPILAEGRHGRTAQLAKASDGQLIISDRRHGERFTVVLPRERVLAYLDASVDGDAIVPGDDY